MKENGNEIDESITLQESLRALKSLLFTNEYQVRLFIMLSSLQTWPVYSSAVLAYP